MLTDEGIVKGGENTCNAKNEFAYGKSLLACEKMGRHGAHLRGLGDQEICSRWQRALPSS